MADAVTDPMVDLTTELVNGVDRRPDPGMTLRTVRP